MKNYLSRRFGRIAISALCLPLAVACNGEPDRNSLDKITFNGRQQHVVCALLSSEDLADHNIYTVVLSSDGNASTPPAALGNFVQLGFSAEAQQATVCTSFRYVYTPQSGEGEYVVQIFQPEELAKLNVRFEITSTRPLKIAVGFDTDSIELSETYSGGSIRTALCGTYNGTVATEPKGRAFWYTPVSEFVEAQEF